MIENILNNKALKIDVILKWVATLILIIGTFIINSVDKLFQ